MQTLEQLIEEEIAGAVGRIVRLSQRAEMSAFETHFHRALQRSSGGPKPVPSPTPKTAPAGKSKRAPSVRRDPGEFIALSERFLEVVRSDPGQPMSALAPRVGVSAAELQVPVGKLKAAKQIKTVGYRSLMRYFPVGQDVAA